jgi:glycosyltransferase involved in cell wall biosynthesis
MPPISAIVHAENDALRLGRALEMLLPCAEILVVDHNSRDATRRVAQQYGARIVPAANGPESQYLLLAPHDWIFCLQPTESLSEALQATLYEWRRIQPEKLPHPAAFSVFVREETADGWLDHPAPEIRLVPRYWAQWQGRIPVGDSSATVLEGELLRFSLP